LTCERSINLFTKRLVLRATEPADIGEAIEIRSNFEVARNLSGTTFPPDVEKMTNWFTGHAEEWHQGTAYRLSITFDARFIGICDIFDIEQGQGEIGYWLDQTVWGQGFGLEAIKRLVRFAFEDVGLTSIRAGCVDDNIASAKILERLGFIRLKDTQIFSTPRNKEVIQRRFLLTV
jgi:[ribosomal protein S5]-alanine N-acetyltransferase